MNITKAEKVKRTYDSLSNNKAGYALAVDAAVNLGGIKINDSNDGNREQSFTPNVTFEFDDLSSVRLTDGGVFANTNEKAQTA